MPESRLHFAGRVRHALNDENLQRALTSAMTGIRGRRDAGFADFDFTKGREDLKRRRRANLDRLPELARQFAERLEAVGGQVHFAADAAEARDIIGQLCWNAAAEHAPSLRHQHREHQHPGGRCGAKWKRPTAEDHRESEP